MAHDVVEALFGTLLRFSLFSTGQEGGDGGVCIIVHDKRVIPGPTMDGGWSCHGVAGLVIKGDDKVVLSSQAGLQLDAVSMNRCCSSSRAGFSYDDRVVLGRGLGRLDIGELLGGQIVGQPRSQSLAGAGQLLPEELSVVPLLGGLLGLNPVVARAVHDVASSLGS